MKSKKPFCVSGALMKEIFRMYWYIPVITFVLYFFSGIMPILSNLSDVESIDYYIYDSLKNLNLAYTCIMSVTPVITAVLMMGFIHKPEKAMMMHILPLSKNRIFNSYYISGWLICVVPILLMAIPYMLLALKIEFLGRADILLWLFSSIAVMTLFYGITVLAGTLTGTVIMNIMSAGVLMIIFPLIVEFADSYCEIFISGYCEMPGWLRALSENYNPAVSMFFRHENRNGITFLIYFIIGILLSVCGRLIYKTRKLEYIGNSTLSRVFEEVMTFLLVFTGMSFFGLMMWTFSSSKMLIVAGMFVGTLLTFFVVKIIVNRSVRIFSRDFVRSLSVYFVIAIVFMALTVFDITGFAKRVPDIDEVESVEMDDFISDYNSSVIYGYVSKDNDNSDREFNSPESLEKIIELHQYIVDEHLYEENRDIDSDSYAEVYDMDGNSVLVAGECVHLTYNLKNGSRLERTYVCTMDNHAAKLIDELFTSDEYIEKNRVLSYVDMETVSYIQITGLTDEYFESYYDYDEYGSSGTDYGSEYEKHVMNSGNIAVIENPKLIKKVFEAWDKDMKNCGYIYNNRGVSDIGETASIEVFFKETKAKKKGKDKYRQDSITFIVSDYDENTISCLIEAGYGYTIGKKKD